MVLEEPPRLQYLRSAFARNYLLSRHSTSAAVAAMATLAEFLRRSDLWSHAYEECGLAVGGALGQEPPVHIRHSGGADKEKAESYVRGRPPGSAEVTNTTQHRARRGQGTRREGRRDPWPTPLAPTTPLCLITRVGASRHDCGQRRL